MSSEKQTWRLFTSASLLPDLEVALNEEEHHYAVHVLRLGAGDVVELSNGTGCIARAEFMRADKKSAILKIRNVTEHTSPQVCVHVFLGMPKPATLEEVAELASELGATSLHVFRAARTQFKNEPKLEKLQRQSREALRINKSPFATDVHCYSNLNALFAAQVLQKCGLVLLCDESPLYAPDHSKDHAHMHNHIINVLQLHLKSSPQTLHVGIVIGPEASFTEEERAFFIENTKAIPVTLGARILRVPTAVAAAVSCVLGSLEAQFTP